MLDRDHVESGRSETKTEASNNRSIPSGTRAARHAVRVQTQYAVQTKELTTKTRSAPTEEAALPAPGLDVRIAEPAMKTRRKAGRTVLAKERRAAEQAEESTAIATLQPVASPIRGRRAQLEKEPLAILTVNTASGRATERTPNRPPASDRSPGQSTAMPRKPSTRLRPHEQPAPTVKIGTIDVHVAPPAAPQKMAVVRSSGRSTATSLSRGFTTPFGLRQG